MGYLDPHMAPKTFTNAEPSTVLHEAAPRSRCLTDAQSHCFKTWARCMSHQRAYVECRNIGDIPCEYTTLRENPEAQ